MAALPVERTLCPGSSMITEMKVDLPVPLRPTSPTFSPAPTTNEASRSRVRSPISMVREEPTIIRRGGATRSRSEQASEPMPGGPDVINHRQSPTAGSGFRPRDSVGPRHPARHPPGPDHPVMDHGPEGELMDRPEETPVGHAHQPLGAQSTDLLDAGGMGGRDPEPQPRLAAEPGERTEHQALGLASLDGPPVDGGTGLDSIGATQSEILSEQVTKGDAHPPGDGPSLPGHLSAAVVEVGVHPGHFAVRGDPGRPDPGRGPIGVHAVEETLATAEQGFGNGLGLGGEGGLD